MKDISPMANRSLTKTPSAKSVEWRFAGPIAAMLMAAILTTPGPTRSQLLAGPPGAPRMLTFKDVVFRPGHSFTPGSIFPKGVKRPNVAGMVTMVCTIGVNQRLKDCKIVSENPPKMGFGAAAVRFYGFFTVDPLAKDGSRTAGRLISVDMKFREPDRPLAPGALPGSRKLR